LVQKAKDRLPRLNRRALVQGHCHHKSVLGFDAERDVFAALGLDVEHPASGCCGMAGSFGFEADKYALSVACGEREILPAVRRASEQTLILADGFSCRTHIEQGTGRVALHLAEALKLAFDGAPEQVRPEAAIVDRRRAELRRSATRARIGLAALALGLAGAALLWRKRQRSRA
jgi:Fe-S oxidoreductase